MKQTQVAEGGFPHYKNGGIESALRDGVGGGGGGIEAGATPPPLPQGNIWAIFDTHWQIHCFNLYTIDDGIYIKRLPAYKRCFLLSAHFLVAIRHFV